MLRLYSDVSQVVNNTCTWEKNWRLPEIFIPLSTWRLREGTVQNRNDSTRKISSLYQIKYLGLYLVISLPKAHSSNFATYVIWNLWTGGVLASLGDVTFIRKTCCGWWSISRIFSSRIVPTVYWFVSSPSVGMYYYWNLILKLFAYWNDNLVRKKLLLWCTRGKIRDSNEILGNIVAFNIKIGWVRMTAITFGTCVSSHLIFFACVSVGLQGTVEMCILLLRNQPGSYM